MVSPPKTNKSAGRYRIGAVSTLTGVSPHALRVWERRYQSVTPQRTPGGDRLYSESDIERLRLIKQLIERGHSIGQIANLDAGELTDLIEKHAAPPAPPAATPASEVLEVQEVFLQALGDLDLERAERLLSRAAVALDPDSLIFDVLTPLLQQIGERWEAGQLRIAHEHAASAMLRNLLGALIRTYSVDSDAPVAVIASPSNELHEFGALLAAMIAVTSGWRVAYLGPNLPAEEIAFVVDARKARLLLLSLVLRDQIERENELRRLDELIPLKTPIVAGGHAAEEAREFLPRARRITDLREFGRYLRQHR